MTQSKDHLEAALHRSMIENTLSRYAWAYDMDELTRIGDCFTGTAEVLFATGLQIGRSAIVGELERRRAKYRPLGQVPWHIITNIYVQLETPINATVSSWWSFGAKEDNQPMMLSSFGWYDDKFLFDENDWRIQTRRILGVGQR